MRDREKTSTKLNIGSSRLYLDNGQWRECGRRTPRALVEPSLHPVSISLPRITKTPFRVRTVAELGAFCVVNESCTLSIAIDHVVDVTLVIEDKEFHLLGGVRSIQDDGFALEFINPPEEARQMIRQLLKPEFLAKTLSPCMSFSTVEPGATSTLIYSDGYMNSLQISLFDQRVLSVQFDLEVLDLRLAWRKSDTRKSGIFSFEKGDSGDPKRILSFMKHLQGLTQEIYTEIESILIDGKTF